MCVLGRRPSSFASMRPYTGWLTDVMRRARYDDGREGMLATDDVVAAAAAVAGQATSHGRTTPHDQLLIIRVVWMIFRRPTFCPSLPPFCRRPTDFPRGTAATRPRRSAGCRWFVSWYWWKPTSREICQYRRGDGGVYVPPFTDERPGALMYAGGRLSPVRPSVVE